MAERKIVEIDEERCDGCGLCVPSCAEGAIQVIDGKARLVSDVYCDGLGACLGTCPQDAIRIIQREADPFDEEEARRNAERHQPSGGEPAPSVACPGTAAQDLHRPAPGPARGAPQPSEAAGGEHAAAPASALGHWPVQLRLVPPNAPFLQGAHLLLVADCVPFAYADFHRRFLRGRPVVVGCPKLDDAEPYVDKLAEMLSESSIQSLSVLHMEVPCCTGLLRIAAAAVAQSGCDVPVEDVTITIRGEVLEPQEPPGAGGLRMK